ncbi:MAG: hypothetical protein R3C19_13910 [Planctomycetaceae bacterium]
MSRFLTAIISAAGVLTCAVVLSATTARAQTDDPSHRWLRPPSADGANVWQQLQLLTQLQRMAMQRELDRGEVEAPQNFAHDSDAGQYEQLRQFADQFRQRSDDGRGTTGSQEAPVTGADPNSLMPLLRSALDDPAVSQQARQMLQQMASDANSARPSSDAGGRPIGTRNRDGGEFPGQAQQLWPEGAVPPPGSTGEIPGELLQRLIGSSSDSRQGDSRQNAFPLNNDPPLPAAPETLPAAGSPAEPISRNGAITERRTQSGPPAATDSSQAAPEADASSLRKQFLDPLSESELADAFRNILKEARAEGIQPSSGTGLQSAADQASLMKLLEGLRGDLVDVLKDVILKQMQNQGNSNDVPADQSGSAGGSSAPAKNTATDWLRQISEAPSPAAGAGVWDRLSFPNLDVSSILNLLVMLAAAAFVVPFVLRKLSGRRSGIRRAKTELSLMPINSAADIVEAFHRLVAITKNQTELWWPHRRAAAALVQDAPLAAGAAAILADLYEQVRYSPPGTTLTPEQLDEARAALRRCVSC